MNQESLSHSVSADLPAVAPHPDILGYVWVDAATPQRFPIRRPPATLTFGRALNCDVRVGLSADLLVSRQHACIEVHADGIYLRDLGTPNGTWLNAVRVVGPARLQHGDWFCLGDPTGPRVVVNLSIGEETSPKPERSQRYQSAAPSAAQILVVNRSAVRDEQNESTRGELERLLELSVSNVLCMPAARQIKPALSSSDARQLTESCLGVDAPLEMTLGSTALVRAVAIRDAIKKALVRGALTQENRQLLNVLLGPAVCMKLVPMDPQDFEIRPLTPARQRVRRDKLAVWEWLITSNQAGEEKLLLLSVTSLTTAAGYPVGESMPSRQLRIRVKVSGPTDAWIFSTAGLRQLLAATLRSDSEFEAFCGDHFPAVLRRFGCGMDHVAKVNLLLTYEKGPTIVAALQVACPTFAKYAEKFALKTTAPDEDNAAPSFCAAATPVVSASLANPEIKIPSPDFALGSTRRAKVVPRTVTPGTAQQLGLAGTAVGILAAIGLFLFKFLSR